MKIMRDNARFYILKAYRDCEESVLPSIECCVAFAHRMWVAQPKYLAPNPKHKKIDHII